MLFNTYTYALFLPIVWLFYLALPLRGRQLFLLAASYVFYCWETPIYGALLVISLILLSNTIRLAIFSKRYLINTMKLVGATKWFIMKPFLGSSITQGILAGLGASLLFGLSVFGLNEAVPELTTIAESGKIAVILGAMIAGGVVISGLFTVAALNKFVNMKSNKIYLY